jgi:hypothetical protein
MPAVTAVTLTLQPIEEMPETKPVLVVWRSQGSIGTAKRLTRGELFGLRLWSTHYVEPDGWMDLPEVEAP